MKKIFISVDFEGCNGITSNTQLYPSEKDYEYGRQQVTKEVLACCQGALDAGVSEIWIRDAHGTARNLKLTEFPDKMKSHLKLISGWWGSPWTMVEGLDSSFDATLFVGYHSASGSNGNALAHTFSSDFITTLNGVRCSEFLLNSYSSLYFNVPVRFVSGDANICKEAKNWSKDLITVETIEGRGNGGISEHPSLVYDKIKSGVCSSLSNKRLKKTQVLPKMFTWEVEFRRAKFAYSASFFPKAKLKDERTVLFETKDFAEGLTAFYYISMAPNNGWPD